MAVAEGTTQELLATDKCDLCKPYREIRSRPLVRQEYFVASEGVKIFKQAANLSLQYSNALDAAQRNTGGLIGFFGPSGAGKTAAGLRYTLHMRANYNRFHDLQYLYLSFKNGWSQEAFTTYEERGFSVEQYALVLMDHVFRGLVLSSDAEQPSVNNPSAALLELGKHYAKAVAAISGGGCHPSVVLHIDEHTAVHKDPKTRRIFFDCLTNLSLKLREEGFCMFLVATSIGAPPPSHSHEEDGDGSSKSVYRCLPIPNVDVKQAAPFLDELLPLEGKGTDKHAHDFGHLCMQIVWSIPAVGKMLASSVGKYAAEIHAAHLTGEEQVAKTLRLCQSAVAAAWSGRGTVPINLWSSRMSALALGIETDPDSTQELEPWVRSFTRKGHVIPRTSPVPGTTNRQVHLTIPCAQVLFSKSAVGYKQFRCGSDCISGLGQAITLARSGLWVGMTCLESSFVSEAVGVLALLCMIHAHEHLHLNSCTYKYATRIPTAEQFSGLSTSNGIFGAASSEESASEEPFHVLSTLGHELHPNVVYVPRMVDKNGHCEDGGEDDIEERGECGDGCRDNRELDNDECVDILQPWLEFQAQLHLSEFHPLVDIWYVHSDVFWLISVTDRRSKRDLAAKRKKLQTAMSLMRDRVQQGLQCADGTTVRQARGMFWDGLELRRIFASFPIWSDETHKMMVNKGLSADVFC
eukprot:TRINITY_DN19477_c0_g1_i1.p1 TRINITY_DN19477_c0_g1~~TRINITY_DN19477_c0_g1_i1.p1  ORF type:complete len:743 (+),score=67.53 TRINITY_DN19477_c0_g1_i1:154-2229(+)